MPFGVSFAPVPPSVPPSAPVALWQPSPMGKTLVIIAHGNGRPADLVQIPNRGGKPLCIGVFNDSKAPMWTSDVLHLAAQLNQTGVVPEQVNGLRLKVSMDQFPNYLVTFKDGNGAEAALAPLKLGMYVANPALPQAKLQRVPCLQFEQSHMDMQEIVSWCAGKDYEQILLLTCRTGPSARVEGIHIPDGWCKNPHAQLIMNQTYDDLCLETLTCLECGADLQVTRICFFDCQFRMEARSRANVQKHALPLGASLQTWQPTNEQEVTVNLDGVVRLKVETQACLPEH